MTPRAHALALAVVALTISAACSIDLVPLTDPPPTRVASVSASNREIEISKGVALAVSCEDSCDGVCQSAKLTSNAPWIADVMSAYMVTPEGEDASRRKAVFVIVGVEPGDAEITVESECSEEVYDVAVLGH